MTDPRAAKAGGRVVPHPRSPNVVDYRSGRGRTHPIGDGIQRFRETLLGLGFSEIENSYFVPEDDIRRLYPCDHPGILQETYYLSSLRPMRPPFPPETVARVQAALPGIPIGKMEARLAEELGRGVTLDRALASVKEELKMDDAMMARLADAIVPASDGALDSQRITLRKEMLIAWLPTVRAVQKRASMPVKLFCVGVGFHREAVLDAMHLRNHYMASFVILDKRLDHSSAMETVFEVLKHLGLGAIDQEPGDALTGICKPNKKLVLKSNGVKVGECGEISEDILRRYEIDGELFVVDLGLEHVVMAEEGYPDIRELLYPQFYNAWSLSDEEIAMSVRAVKRPRTDLGLAIARAVKRGCIANHAVKTPAKVELWKGDVFMPGESDRSTPGHHRKLTIVLENPYPGATLCGPAYKNRIHVLDGDVLGRPGSAAGQAGASSRLSYIDGFSLMVGHAVERAIGMERITVHVGMVKSLADVNLQLDKRAYRFLKSNRRLIDVKGPMFVTVNINIEQLD